MTAAAIPLNEKERLESLAEYSILNTLPERDFDDITQLASEICGTPVSLITLIDSDRQWVKSNYGLKISESPRKTSFCGHAINNPSEMMVVPDAREDVRFADNPFVKEEGGVVFYTGVPLVNIDGFALGTLCILDYKPRALDAHQNKSLKALARLVVKLFELRRKNSLLDKTRKSLEQINTELQQFAYVVSHDIKSPVNNIIAFSEMLKNEHSARLDDQGQEIITYLNKSASKLKDFIEGILSYYKSDRVPVLEKNDVVLPEMLKNITSLLDPQKEFDIDFSALPDSSIRVNKISLEQIFINLISNAMKYNDKKKGVIEILFSNEREYYEFGVRDNGSGIEEKNFEKIFSVFETLGKMDRYENIGTGIGLSTVKKLVERAGGSLSVTSVPGTGSTFRFTLKK